MAPIGDDRGDNRSPAARRGSLPLLATAGWDPGADPADPHDLVASRTFRHAKAW